jgi:predicted RNA-binding protein Jag
MSKESAHVEGASLEEALQNAAKELGVERNQVAFEYDREHLASGASTVRIRARVKSAEDLAKEAARSNAAPSAPRRDDGGPRRSGGDRDRDRDRGPRGGGGDRRPRDRDRDRGRGPREDRDRGPREYKPPEKDPVRDERLREQARELARRVLAGEGPLTIEDLNSYERHLVHTAVAEIGGLETKSVGEQLRKTVHITKKEA